MKRGFCFSAVRIFCAVRSWHLSLGWPEASELGVLKLALPQVAHQTLLAVDFQKEPLSLWEKGSTLLKLFVILDARTGNRSSRISIGMPEYAQKLEHFYSTDLKYKI